MSGRSDRPDRLDRARRIGNVALVIFGVLLFTAFAWLPYLWKALGLL